MAQTIHGTFGEMYELRSRIDLVDVGPPTTPEDPAAQHAQLLRLLEDPLNQQAFQRALAEAHGALGRCLTPAELRLVAWQHLAVGDLVLVRIHEDWARSGGAHKIAKEEPPKPEPPKTKEIKIRDWTLECAHHAASASRALLQQGKSIQVLPDVGKTKDKVKLWWKDEPLGAIPGQLPVYVRQPAGKPERVAKMESGGGDTGTYAFDAEFLGDLNAKNFISPSFWQAFRNPTVYSIAKGPTPIDVEVFNPRQYKFELSFPPLAGYKAGAKFEAEGLNPKALANPKAVTKKVESEATGWSPSKLQVKSYKTASHPDADFKPEGSDRALVESVKFTRDGYEVEIDAVKFVGTLLELSAAFRDVVSAIKKFKDYAPSVGWYMDFGLQLMQGGLAVEWYWKEYKDHRVFQYVDFALSLKIFSVEFEVGLGVSAFSFKLQIFAQISGEMAVEGGFRREKPEGAPGFSAPLIKGKVTGALGARFEAGALFKFEAKGETAVEMELGLGINRPGREPVSFDFRARWTGIECTCKGSTGLFGIGGVMVWKERLVPESNWVGFEFTKEKEYKPPTISRDRIAQVLKDVITKGWDLRVIKPSGKLLGIGDVHWTADQIAAALADKIDADRAVDRAPDTIDGLAHSIREDLDLLGRRGGRDYVDEATFRAYLAGPKLKQRLRNAYSAERIALGSKA